ncbi:MAG: type IX secretion system membrane protein PorP/SprF [Candidatus Omnitrophica bacterium]|nr:type IX secretion system membrane protein PorP/SprF [Candidatus Omnitrophota bacterium]MCF7892468.1 type IX secretion system membrane protein PorP/SprF [Candidatus Omnitrophota bacterium]MCF7897587.1 type IX secretion system membrane protein PorP/SprF [Candidatus Omnitrophota bacterium]MCF7909973.1 type IX secretion system membrane protein PorP/SprF [Candidatus Omnitrophota bacterium]
MIKKFNIYISLILTFIPLFTSSSYADTGSRPMSMGGAFIAVSDDINATYWNPAGLTQIKNLEITYTGTIHNRDEFYYNDFASIAMPLRIKEKNWGSLGFSFINSGRNQTPSSKTTDRWYWLSYGINLFDGLSLGTNLRGQVYKTQSGSAIFKKDNTSFFAADLALLWYYKKFSFGILWQRINEPTIKVYGQKNKYSSNLRLGTAFRPDNKTIISMDIDDTTGEVVNQNLRIGIERWFTDNFAIRIGGYDFNSNTNAAITFGIGLKTYPKNNIFNSLHLDYNLMYWTKQTSGYNDFTHQIGVTFKF